MIIVKRHYFTTFHLMYINCSTKPEDDLIQNQNVGRAFLFLQNLVSTIVSSILYVCRYL